MIIVKLQGGLGNQMFQYALGRRLALKNNAELRLDVTHFEQYGVRRYELHVFNIFCSVASKRNIKFFRKFNNSIISKIAGRHYKYVKEKNLYFDKTVLEKKGNIYLDGYWQSEKYFKDIREIIVKDFAVRNEPDTKNKSLLEKIKNSNSVGLHIRRGDYVSDEKINKFHGTCPLEYYYNAVKIVEKIGDPEFFVFSDGPEWTKMNLKLQYPTFYSDNNPKRGYEDLRLMSHCKHFIIANSSFSWWGAWLSDNLDKIVCAPKTWFAGQDEGDVVPESWIRVEG